MQNRPTNLRDFDVIGKLGQGAFGQVFKVKRKADGKQYALKKVKIGAMKEKQRENALNQIRILASYNDQYIIGYKQAFYDEVSGSLCVVMEFASGGDILKRNQTHIKSRTRYKQDEIWKAMVHMTKGLHSLHDRKILHRDLKCANVFITLDNVYKLGDLNVSKVLKKDMALTQTGTPYYASPEVWKDKPYNAKSDMWSLGCVLYEMAALKPPFTANDLQGLYKKVCAGLFERIPMSYSNDLANVISWLLKVDPDKRPTSQQLLGNNLVRKYYSGEIQQEITNEEQFDDLLKTIKFNPKDLKALKHILPKANYEEEIFEKEKLRIEDLKGGVQSCKNARKEPDVKQEIKASLEQNEKKLTDFIERRKVLQEKERQRQLKIILEQKEEIAKKRERVLSACGIRPPPNLYEAPKLIASKKEITKESTPKLAAKQQEGKVLPKMPPKPQGAPNVNYKLPPKPSIGNAELNVQQRPSHKNIVQAKNIGQINKIKSPVINSGSRPNRSNSMQRVIYPSWWG